MSSDEIQKAMLAKIRQITKDELAEHAQAERIFKRELAELAKAQQQTQQVISELKKPIGDLVKTDSENEN